MVLQTPDRMVVAARGGWIPRLGGMMIRRGARLRAPPTSAPPLRCFSLNHRSPSSSGTSRGLARPPNEVTLIQALDVESRLGYTNIRGHRYPSFHLFLLAQLNDFTDFLDDKQLHNFRRELVEKTERYPHMVVPERQRTLAQVKTFLERYWRITAESGRAGTHETRDPVPASSTSGRRHATLQDVAPFNLFFFDIETTGLSSKNDRIVEVAVTALHSRENWSTLVDPQRDISPQASQITGLTASVLKDANAPTFDAVARAMIEFVREQSLPISHATFVAHNVRFDSRFLEAEFARAGIPIPDNWRFFDSLEFSRKILGKDAVKSFSLQNLNRHFDLPPPQKDHRAADDVATLIQVFETIVARTTSDRVVKLIHDQRIRVEPRQATMAPPEQPTTPRPPPPPPSATSFAPEASLREAKAEASKQLPELPRFSKRGVDPLQRRAAKTPWAEAGEEGGPTMETEGSGPLREEVEVGERAMEFLTSGIPMASLNSFTPLQKQQQLEAGFDTLASLLQHYPRDYLLYSGEWKDNDFICSQGRVAQCKSFASGKKGFVEAEVRCENGNVVKIKQWYHFRSGALAQRALRGIVSRFPVDSLMAFKGKLKHKKEQTWDLTGSVQMTSLEEMGTPVSDEITPIYPSRSPLTSKQIAKAMQKAMLECPENAEVIPLDIVRKYKLMRHKEALRKIHFPSTMEEAEEARRSLVFQELFVLQSALMLRRVQQVPADANKFIEIGRQSDLLSKGIEALPYALTSAQERVLEEVLEDMAGAPPMMRLLQGDVGSGKTIVSLLAMMSVVDSGWQCALMVPTEILALQHAKKLEEFLALVRARAGGDFEAPKVVVLTGSMKAREKKEAMEATADGSARITFGTHALISEGVQFKKLGLAVIDEQHKFGVEQRSKLQSKNHPPPHLLSMSATPIPRTLALTMYGEMAISYIEEMPSGRKPVKTLVYRQSDANERSRAYDKLVSEVRSGNKGFVVFPLIEESESDDFQSVKAAEASFDGLSRNELRGVSCGLLHGRLQSQEKLEAQSDFISGRTQVLVATAVIEVGVDIPEATVIIIENAERFGLAQLHQLRGRVGRSNRESHCFFLTGGTEASHRRVAHMERLSDGFQVSETDMALRGPGEFLGTKQAGQSGLPSLQLADMKSAEDMETLEAARAAAAEAFADGEPKMDRTLLLHLKSSSPIPFLDIAPEQIHFAE